MKTYFKLALSTILGALLLVPSVSAQDVRVSEIRQSATQHTSFVQKTAAATIDFAITNGNTYHVLTYKTTGFSGLTVTFYGSVDGGSNYTQIGTSTTTGGASITGSGTYTSGRIIYSGLTGSGTLDADYYGNIAQLVTSGGIQYTAIPTALTAGQSGDLNITPEQWLGVSTLATGDSNKGALRCILVSAASTNATNCKTSGGNVYGFRFINTTTVIYYLRMYNSASNPPTCSSATGFIESIPIPPGAAAGQAGGLGFFEGFGEAYTAGIGFCFTGLSTSTDTTVAATGVFGAVLYK